MSLYRCTIVLAIIFAMGFSSAVASAGTIAIEYLLDPETIDSVVGDVTVAEGPVVLGGTSAAVLQS